MHEDQARGEKEVVVVAVVLVEVVLAVVAVGGGDSPYRNSGEKKQSSPVQPVYSKTLLCLWLTEESFWRLWCAATPHFSRQTALGQSSEGSPHLWKAV